MRIAQHTYIIYYPKKRNKKGLTVIEIIVNAIDDYCLLLLLFFTFCALHIFLLSTFVDRHVLLLSTFFHFPFCKSTFWHTAKRKINSTFLYVATMAFLYL